MNWRMHRTGIIEAELASRPTKEWCDRYQEFLSAMLDASFVVDAEAHILCWNSAAERLYGLKMEEMLGRDVAESHDVRWLEEGDEEKALNSLRVTGGWKGVHVHVLKGGLERHVECSASLLKNEQGQPFALLAVLRDVTERWKLEERLEATQAQLMLAQRVARLGWFDWDVLRNVSLSSDEAHLLHGLAPGSFQGGYEQWKEFVHPDDREEVERSVIESLRAGGEHSHVNRVVWPDQSVHWLQSRIKVFLDDNGRAERVIGVFFDVTELKQAEEMARVACQELERRVALRTAALEESRQEMETFVYSISHDLRAPLRAMGGFAQAVRQDEGGRLRPVSRENLHRVEQAAQRMDALICALVDYTGMQHREISFVPVVLDDLLDDALLSFADAIEQQGASLAVRHPLGSVMGDRATLKIVLSNLVSNALKFVAEGVPPEISIWTEERERRVRLFVKDNGIGFEPAYDEKVFRVFERLHRENSYPGVGIGLAIAKKGVERLGGQIGVFSAPNEGSCFWVDLTQAEHATEPPSR